MCRSVPQMDAAFTRTSTSVGPIAGTCAASIESPRAACIFRNAFMLVASQSAPNLFCLPFSAFQFLFGPRVVLPTRHNSMLAHASSTGILVQPEHPSPLCSRTSETFFHVSLSASFLCALCVSVADSSGSAFLSPLIHPHHFPGRWIFLVQVCGLPNQLLHSRPFHIRYAPQLHVAHALPFSFQQLLRVGEHCSTQK